MEEYVKIPSLGRLEKPENVAKVILCLASLYLDFTTRQVINVRGGIETN
jgi:hypothetical protein